MSDPRRPQSLANHRRIPRVFAAFTLVLLAEVVHRLWVLVTVPSAGAAWGLVVAVAILFALFNGRLSAVRVQDRLIRLEMRRRLQHLLGKERHDDIGRIELPQLVALRFASDAELPGLVEDVLTGKLTTQPEIKQRIADWQADWLRV